MRIDILEILAPGIRIPTFDAKLAPKKGFEVICGLRRSALDLAYGQAETRGYIEEILAGRAFNGWSLRPAGSGSAPRDRGGASASPPPLRPAARP